MKASPVVHFEMPAKDKKRAAKFYEEALGWDMKIVDEMGAYLLANTGPTENGRPTNPGTINGGFFDYDETKPGFQYPSVVVAVEDIKQGIEMVKKAGGKVFGEPMDIPTVGKFVSFEDTEGNRVGMLQPSM